MFHQSSMIKLIRPWFLVWNMKIDLSLVEFFELDFTWVFKLNSIVRIGKLDFDIYYQNGKFGLSKWTRKTCVRVNCWKLMYNDFKNFLESSIRNCDFIQLDYLWANKHMFCYCSQPEQVKQPSNFIYFGVRLSFFIFLFLDRKNKNKNDDSLIQTTSLSLSDIMPKPQRSYDKNKAPKLLGQPTVVYFHVTGNIWFCSFCSFL